MKKKIIFILQLPPPVHGASMISSNLINSKLVKKNFNIDIINLSFATSIKDLNKFSLLKIYKSVKYAVDITKRILYQRPDLAYFTLSPSGYAFYRDSIYVGILKLFKIRIVFHLHGKGIKRNSETSLLKRRIYRYVFKNCNVICLTASLIKDIEFVSSATPYIVPNGIPVHPRKSGSKIKTHNDLVDILYLSNYVESKGILVLIEALSILREKGYTYRARLVGAATDLSVKAIKNILKSKDIETCVEVVGPKFNDEKYEEFQNSDIFVFPTFYSNETFGLVNLEAMQWGLPIITTTEGGIPEIVINNETGFTIEPKNIVQLVNKLIILIENEKLRKEMGVKGRERFFMNYTIEHFETNMVNVFKDILNKTSKN